MNIKNELESLNIGEVRYDQQLKDYTTYRVGGVVDYLIMPSSIDNLIKLLKFLEENKLSYFILGNGSNVVFNDNKFDKVIIKLNAISNITINDNVIECSAGDSLIKVSNMALKNSLSGLEFASGIPCSVGGAIYMNAGAYNRDIASCLEEVKVLHNNKIEVLKGEECEFEYRSSIFKKNKEYIILSAKFRLEDGDASQISDLINDRRMRRMATQPLEYPSAGSVFRNPTNDYAGRLIEELGYKGKMIGGAMVSDKHANFIINYQNAKGMDIFNLVNDIKEKVKDTYNIELICEQEFINF